jgi:hypothetical protein
MSLRTLFAILLAGAAACTGTNVTVDASGDGGEAVIASPGNPPIVAIAEEGGVHGPPTPTPNSLTPPHPLATPAPTATPRPR